MSGGFCICHYQYPSARQFDILRLVRMTHVNLNQSLLSLQEIDLQETMPMRNDLFLSRHLFSDALAHDVSVE